MTRPTLVTLLPLLLALSGCAGSIAVDGGGGNFGAAASGSLVELKLDDDTLWVFAVSSRPGLCAGLQEAYPAAMDAVDRWGLNIFDGGACDRLWSDLDEAWAEVLGNGVNITFLQESAGARPSEGSFSVGDDWNLNLHYQDENVFSVLAEQEPGCSPGDAGELTRSFGGDSGSLEVSGSEQSGWRLDLDASLEDESGDDAGDMIAGFAMRNCEVDLVGTSAAEMLLGLWALPTQRKLSWHAEF